MYVRTLGPVLRGKAPPVSAVSGHLPGSGIPPQMSAVSGHPPGSGSDDVAVDIVTAGGSVLKLVVSCRMRVQPADARGAAARRGHTSLTTRTVRSWGINAVREMARHRLRRVCFVGVSHASAGVLAGPRPCGWMRSLWRCGGSGGGASVGAGHVARIPCAPGSPPWPALRGGLCGVRGVRGVGAW